MAEINDLDLDYELDELDEAEASHQQTVDKVTPSFFSKNKQLIVILGGGIVLAALIVTGVNLMGGPSGKQKNLLRTTTAIQHGKSNINVNQTLQSEVKPKKKKRKKVKYEKLFTLEGVQAADVVKELSFANILFKTEQSGGTKFIIFVDQAEHETALNLLAIKGLPSGGAKGYALLDNTQTLGVTEFDKRVRFLRALSGELEKAIIQFEMIESAKVQIVLPEQRLFSVTQPPVTSSILIRRMKGIVLTDDVVFSIIELISNAVENLQPENVSVIDTSGFVLSQGIFERMAARKKGGNIKHPKPLKPDLEADKVITRKDAMGQPFIPNYERISEWFDVKWEFEKVLAAKAMKQLRGVLPFGSYKVAVSSEIGPIENGEIVDVRRLTVSVVVDQNNDEIYLDQQMKKEVYNTVASAIGYVKGRDSIILSMADFVLLSNQERRYLEKIMGLNTWGGLPMLLAVGLGLGVIGAVTFGYRFYVNQQQKRLSDTGSIANDDADTEMDFMDLQGEIENEKCAETLYDFAVSKPGKMADLLSRYMSEDDGDGAPLLEDDPVAEDLATEGVEDKESLDFEAEEDNDNLFDEDEVFEQDIFSELPELQEDVVS